MGLNKGCWGCLPRKYNPINDTQEYRQQQQYRKILEVIILAMTAKTSFHAAQEKAMVNHTCIFTRKHKVTQNKVINVLLPDEGFSEQMSPLNRRKSQLSLQKSQFLSLFLHWLSSLLTF